MAKKQALGAALALVSGKLAAALGGTATLIFGVDPSEQTYDPETDEETTHPETTLDVPFTPGDSRRETFASNVPDEGTNAAANVAGRELFGTIPGNALPETPRVGRDKIVFNGATYRIVAVEEKFSQNVLVDVVVSATRI
ncbi:MAG: hypothetical protein J6K25_15095 [Thermoguttaceae bacterium]|nr:hypothetical protein [Thermoguttaceae bacterium]